MDPIQAMARKIRSDAGHNSAMPASQLSELDRQYKRNRSLPPHFLFILLRPLGSEEARYPCEQVG